MRNGDIFRWSYKSGGDSNTYWACSRIAIFNDGVFKDTWPNKKWSLADATERLDLEFIANEEDLVSIDQHQVDYYLRKDIVDLSHPNRRTGLLFIRKGSQKNLEKMELAMIAHIEKCRHDIAYEEVRLRNLLEGLANLTVDSYLPCHNDRLYIPEPPDAI